MKLTEFINEYIGKWDDIIEPPRYQRRTVEVYYGHMLLGLAVDMNYTVTREGAPMYIMGNPDPRTFARGRRRVINGSVTGLGVRDREIEYLMDARRRGAIPLTFNVNQDGLRGQPLTLDFSGVDIIDLSRSRFEGDYSISFIAKDLNQYETPSTNKQAAKLLLKR